jgi:hypothetical protein
LALFSKTSKTKTTVNMTLTTQSQERLFREAGGHLELGLTDASEELIANYEALFGEDPRSLTLRKSIASRRGDYDTHDPSHSRFASQPFYGQRHLGGALFSDWMRCEEDKRRKKISQPD